MAEKFFDYDDTLSWSIERMLAEKFYDHDDTFSQVIARMNHKLEMIEFQIVHELTWGVSCGPTLAMIPETKPPTAFERYLKGTT